MFLSLFVDSLECNKTACVPYDGYLLLDRINNCLLIIGPEFPQEN